MDADAKEEAAEIVQRLTDAGIQAVLLDDSAPGVPEGVFEVQVPVADAARADQLISEDPPEEEVENVDESEELDLETVYHGEATPTAEIEAMDIKNLLESNGIAAVVIGDSVLPNLAFEVRVARNEAERARALIADAQSQGPAAAAEGELESESGVSPEQP